MRGFAVPVLVRLYREQPASENQLRTTVPYSSLLTALGDLEQAGWVEKVQTRLGRDGQGRISRVLKWRLTEKGTKVALMLESTATLMDVLDGPVRIEEDGDEREE